MVVVLCYKTGGDFRFSDVELLTHNIRKNWGGELRIFVLTDTTNKIIELNEYTLLPVTNNWPGWWVKMNLFSPEMEKYRPFLYIDLDTAIVGSLDEIVPESKDQFITLEDFYQPYKLASGMMWIPANSDKIKKIWNEWSKDPHRIIRKYRGDQEFIRSVTKQDTFWQSLTRKVFSFKPRAGWLKTLPEGAVVVCFHGKPRIRNANVDWVNKYIRYE